MTFSHPPCLALIFFLTALPGLGSGGQEPREPALSLSETLALARQSYAEIAASRADLAAAEEGVDAAEKAYLPEAELYAQWNRATRNNVFGLVLPGSSLPGISGPALDEKTSESTLAASPERPSAGRPSISGCAPRTCGRRRRAAVGRAPSSA